MTSPDDEKAIGDADEKAIGDADEKNVGDADEKNVGDADEKNVGDAEEEEVDDGHTKSFLGHLEDLRKTIVWAASALVAGMVIAIPLAPTIRWVLRYPLDLAKLNPAPELVILDVTGGIVMAMRLVFWTGMIISMPVIVIAIGGFIFPGLTKRERKAVAGASGFSVALFVGGVAMGYRMTLPVALKFMMSVNTWMGTKSTMWQEPDYVSFVLKLLLAFGIAFQLPVVVLALGHAGIISSAQMRDKRRHVIVGLMIMSMLLTPADPYTMLLMALPMTALYEACIWITWSREQASGSRGGKRDETDPDA